MSHWRTAVLIGVSVVGLRVTEAQAQTAAGPEPGRFEFAIGPIWVGRQVLGSSDANLTTGAGGSLRLFSTSTELAAAAGLEVRAGVRVTRALEVEASASYAKPQLRTVVTSDMENSASVTATDTIQQFTVGGGIVWYPAPRRSSSRLVPFVTGGAAYLRQLHASATLAETGQMYQVGGGLKYLLALRPRAHVKGVGVRVDARAVVRSKGIAFDDRKYFSPAVGTSLFVRF